MCGSDHLSKNLSLISKSEVFISVEKDLKKGCKAGRNAPMIVENDVEGFIFRYKTRSLRSLEFNKGKTPPIVYKFSCLIFYITVENVFVPLNFINFQTFHLRSDKLRPSKGKI